MCCTELTLTPGLGLLSQWQPLSVQPITACLDLVHSCHTHDAQTYMIVLGCCCTHMGAPLLQAPEPQAGSREPGSIHNMPLSFSCQLTWCVTAAGTKSPRRVPENLAAASLQLSAQDLADLEAAVPFDQVRLARGPAGMPTAGCESKAAVHCLARHSGAPVVASAARDCIASSGPVLDARASSACSMTSTHQAMLQKDTPLQTLQRGKECDALPDVQVSGGRYKGNHGTFTSSH